jgi:hypothetical protein
MKTINLKFMLVGLFAMLAVGCGFFSSPASDKSMLENFRAHEADFKKLASMFKEDNLGYVNKVAAAFLPSTERDPPKAAELPPQRLDEYHRLFKQTGVIHIARGEGYISFLTQEGSDPIDGLNKDYVYAENPLSPLVGSLDQIDQLSRYRGQLRKGVYKKIADNWYIEFRIIMLD